MADDKNTKIVAGELSEMTEKNIKFQKEKAKADADLLKEQRKTTVSQNKTTTQLSEKLSDLKTGQAALKEGQKEIAGASTETGDKLVAAQNDNEKTKRQESKENIKEQSKTEKLFTGLGKVFKDKISGLGKSLKDAALNPLKSVGFDPKAVGKSLLSIGAILGLVAFFKSPLFQKLKVFLAKAKPLFKMFINGVVEVFEGIKTVFLFLYDNIWPFIKDNILMNAFDKLKKGFDNIKVLFQSLGENISVLFSEDADWWTRTKAFFGIFKAIGKFFVDQLDNAAAFVAGIFGVSFDPHDGPISYMGAKFTEMFDKIKTFFTETIPETVKIVKDKIKNFFGSIVDNIINLKDSVIEGVGGIKQKIVDGVSNMFSPIVDFFKGLPNMLKNAINKFIDRLPLPDVIKKGLKFDTGPADAEPLVDTDDVGVATEAENLKKQKMKLAEEENVAETLDEIRTKKLMPEYSTADGGLGFSSADIARAKHNYFGSDATIAQDNYADAVNLDDIVGGDRNEPAMRQHLEHIKNLEKENAELKEAASSNIPPIIQNNVNNSQMSSTTNKGTRTIPISGPMHPLYAQAQN